MTAFLHAHTNQLSNPFLVENLERIIFQNSFFQINRKKLTGIVTRITKSHLGKIVRSKREKFGRLCNFIGNQSSTRYFYHSSNQIIYAVVIFGENFFGSRTNNIFLHLHFLKRACERNHYFRNSFYASFLQIKRCFNNSTCLSF